MIIYNKNANRDFDVLETMEAGIELTGAEAKSFHENRVILQGAYVKIIGGEFYLVNAKFTWSGVQPEKQNRSRRLLVHRSEIISWETKIATKKLVILPISMYTRSRFIKLKIGLGKPLKEFSKKDKLKKHDIEREAERDYRAKLS